MLFLSLCWGIVVWALHAQLTFAQSSSATATNVPGAAPTCNAINGLYADNENVTWNMTCGYGSTASSFDNSGTNSQGIYHCFAGCDLRPQCVAFDFKGSAGVTAGETLFVLDNMRAAHVLQRCRVWFWHLLLQVILWNDKLLVFGLLCHGVRCSNQSFPRMSVLQRFCLYRYKRASLVYWLRIRR